MDERHRHDQFDTAAATYDAEFSLLPHVQIIRARVHELITSTIPVGSTILDLGCGTGEDARALSTRGYHVIACDPSEKMIRMAQEKCSASQTMEGCLRLPVEELNAIREGAVDAVLSNFGGLNCVRDIAPILEQISYILRDNGVAVLCLMNRFALWEMFAYLSRGKIRLAFRRWKQSGIFVPVGATSVLVWYHGLRVIKRMLRHRFSIGAVVGLNILSPPPSSMNFRARHPRLVRLLETIERRIDSFPLFSTLGDHYVLILRRFE